MLIRKGSSNKVSPNFTEAEIYNASFGTDGSPFEYSDAVIRGYQIIRDYFGVPIKPTATYRTVEHELSKGRSGKGQHPQRKAGDGAFLDDGSTMLKYHQEILNKGKLYRRLRSAGINAFGLYDTFFHIDSRATGNQSDPEFGNYAFWDNRKKKSSR